MGASGTEVDGCGGQSRYVCQQVIFGVVGEVMGGGDGELWIHLHVGLSAQRVADPSDAQFSNVFDAVHRADRVAGLVNELGFDGIHQAAPTRRMAERRTPRIATVISRPTTGSAHAHPSATPPAPTSTAREVNPSVRACSPSATSAAEPMRRPTRMR